MNAKRKLSILVVEDDEGHRSMLQTLLADWGYQVAQAVDGESAVEQCRQTPYDLVLMDVRMGGMSGIEALGAIREFNPAIPILVMTAYSDVKDAVQAVKAGAYDYLQKPLDFDDLKLKLERAADHAHLREENRRLRDAAGTDDAGIIGRSQPMRQLLEMVAAVAPSDATVLFTGESGTGKELLAKTLHAESARKSGPFIAVNCAAISENLLESELFGHEKGAFTGADRRREGRFMAADKGTLFLDEIGELPLAMQAKLLRAIQEREVQRVGSDVPVKVDVRIVAATNRDLQEEVHRGGFRQDLFYRLNVVTMHVPALRDRPDDIPLLAAHFLRIFADRNGKTVKGFTPAAMDRMVKHAWPGNVRELENCVERAVVLLVGEYVTERELPPTLATSDGTAEGRGWDFAGLTLEEIERAVVVDTVESVGGNKSEAARRLGISRKTLLTKLRDAEGDGAT
ncbi:MAG: sigma-54 dependent transcriptional regulator [Desulfovibrio sp.]|jgi:two-component system response regulator HydG|nr:sigma-54 dependent transcriptional regulator [Desulfovibrio sp.]